MLLAPLVAETDLPAAAVDAINAAIDSLPRYISCADLLLVMAKRSQDNADWNDAQGTNLARRLVTGLTTQTQALVIAAHLIDLGWEVVGGAEGSIKAQYTPEELEELPEEPTATPEKVCRSCGEEAAADDKDWGGLCGGLCADCYHDPSRDREYPAPAAAPEG